MENTIIQKRTAKGIWHNLYEFPLIETEKVEDFESDCSANHQNFFQENKIVSLLEYNAESIIHKLRTSICISNFGKPVLKGTIENGIDLETLKHFRFQ